VEANVQKKGGFQQVGSPPVLASRAETMVFIELLSRLEKAFS
jgi:hypothetical protein